MSYGVKGSFVACLPPAQPSTPCTLKSMHNAPEGTLVPHDYALGHGLNKGP